MGCRFYRTSHGCAGDKKSGTPAFHSLKGCAHLGEKLLCHYRIFITAARGSQTGEMIAAKKEGDRITISFPYNSDCIAKIKTVKGYRRHPEKRWWSVQRFEGAIKRTNLRYIQKLRGHKNSRTTEIYTHVSTRDLGKTQSPLNSLLITSRRRVIMMSSCSSRREEWR